MLEPIRHARRADVAAMIAIAEDGDAPGVDEGYLAFVATHGRLLVWCDDHQRGLVSGFGGAIDVGGAAMVTDLFVAAARRGAGIGAALLAAVVDGFERRMTCSSAHPAARAVYARAGLEPCWPVLVLRGTANGGGPPLDGGPWRHDRRELIEFFASVGADVGADHVLERSTTPGEPQRVLRLLSERPLVDTATLLASLPAGDEVELCVPEPSPVAGWLQQEGFEVVDSDLFCATPGLRPAPELVALHRGLL